MRAGRPVAYVSYIILTCQYNVVIITTNYLCIVKFGNAVLTRNHNLYMF